MPSNALGPLRRSAAATTFGPGAIVDFRAGDATISAVIGGLEEWDRNFPPAGLLNHQAIREERLQKKLNVKGFRLPPVRDPAREADAERALVAVRFPSWLQCPQCDRIGPEERWNYEPGRPGRICQTCTNVAPGRMSVFVIPVRFVMACENGHLDEFPWHAWAGHRESCTNRNGFLLLRSEQAGLAGLILSCPKCGSRRSMDGIFTKETWQRFPNCRGRRPWLAAPPETCVLKARAVQRGASNLYFPVIESALSIPPWSDRLQEALGVHWDAIVRTESEDRATYVRILARGDLAAVLQELQLSPEQLAAEIERRLNSQNAIDTDNLRVEEYRQFTGGVHVQGLDREFEIRPQSVPPNLTAWFQRLVKVTRLREVRAMKGFTRIQPPGDSDDTHIASLSVDAGIDWLPAIEVRGEGIFLELNTEALAVWEIQPEVISRAEEVNRRWKKEWGERHRAEDDPPREITARFLLTHTFAHALMRQLTLDCGYSTTALRERLYVSEERTVMAGLLIYTATTDNDGTLGGLQREGDPARIGRTIISALQAQTWCSSDPLCIENVLSGEEGLSLAACHSCVLAPETSCEEFNRLLDRALLVGTPGDASVGFFSSLIAATV